jgi:hypothetical protein
MVSISRPATHLAGIMEVRVVMLLASVLLLAGVFNGTLCGFDSARIDSDEGIRCSTLATSILSFSASPNRVYTGEEVTFTATASSTTPDTSLTFIIYYDAIVPPYPTNNTNSPYTVHVTGNPGTVTARFAYDRLGNLTTGTDTYFCVRLVVSDGSATTASNLISVYVVENRPPTFEIALSESLPVLVPGEEICMSVRVSDPDGDPVIANWDFGDGTVAVNTTGAALPGVYFNQTHAWYPVTGPGIGGSMYFSLVITLDDSYTHTETATSLVTVVLPPNGSPAVGIAASDTSIDPMDEVTLYANATDPEGEALTWTFVFNNSVEDFYVVVYHTDTTAPSTKVWHNISYSFESPGTYMVRLYVCDGLVPYQSLAHNVTKQVTIRVAGNSLPSVVDEIAMSEESPRIDVNVGFSVVTFTVQTYDADGDVISAVWDLDDGGDPKVNTSAGGLVIYTFMQERYFYQTGVYNISVVVSDGILDHEVVRCREFIVASNNMPPSVSSFNFTYDAGNYAAPGEEIQFSISILDPETDVIEITWDFGDNSPILFFNLTEYVDKNVTCVVSHAYAEVGNYNVTISYSDNEVFGILTHERVKTATVVVSTPLDRIVDHWSWWDYSTLIAVMMIPVALLLNLAQTRRRRKRLEAQGVSLEELKLRESIQVDEPDDFSEEELD